MSLATDYRPQDFEDLCEQKSIISILNYQILNECPKNAYLFVGPAGCGKTTSARILANKLNKMVGAAIEKDAARNNGVDEVRTIIDDAQFQSINSKYKIFILDEIHMLTPQAWNAMLKVLEEPPKSTIFIMCTTDPQKIPATILSRVQRFDFQRISFTGIVNRLKYIIEQEAIKISNEAEATGNYIEACDVFNVADEALNCVARIANGGMRDAISLLEKCLDYNTDLTVDTVTQVVGWVANDTLMKITLAVRYKEVNTIIETIEECYMNGFDMRNLCKQLVKFVLDCKIYYATNDTKLVDIQPEYLNVLQANEEDLNKWLLVFLDKLLDLDNRIKFEANPKLLLEGSLVTLCK